MRKLSFENPDIMDILNHQVIHMDQAVTYCPEYITSGAMKNYPSRTAQVIRAVYLGELPASPYGAEMVFRPILSGQGERWQNFGEKPEGFLLSVILGREVFLKEGYGVEEANQLKEKTAANDGHWFEINEQDLEAWKYEIPTSENSRTGLLLDDATFVYGSKSKEKLGDFLAERGILVSPEMGPYFTGFSYLAAGLIDEGIETVKELLASWKKQGFTKMITLTGQSQYLFTELLPYFNLETDIEFISILDLADGLNIENSYIYGGSFFTRYLRKDKQLNLLSKNETETPILTCPEFLPQVDGDKRKNVVGIWTPPLCAEYEMPDGRKVVEKEVYDYSLGVIKKTHFKNLLVCDPYAYGMLLDQGYDKGKMTYFIDALL